MNGKAVKIAVAFVACCALGVIIYFLAGRGGRIAGQAPEAPPAPPAPETQAPAVQPPAPAPAKENEETGANAQAVAGIGEKLNEILLSGMEYYTDIVDNSVTLTQNGRLYDGPAEMSVTPGYLHGREYLSGDYLIDGAEILYVRSVDIAAISPEYAQIDNGSEEFKIFAAAPFEDGYLVDAKGIGEQIKISAADFESLLSAYNIEHGEIRRVTGSSADFTEIISAIDKYNGASADYYVRYGMRDDKYAVMIVSQKKDYNTIREYALVNENGSWAVKVPNLEAVPKARNVVNNVCWDLNDGLMPKYDVQSYQGRMLKDFSGIMEALVNMGFIDDESMAFEYISATDKFLFAKFENGQMFAGSKDGDMWALGETDTAEEAFEYFRTIDERAPDFVIIWE